MGTDEASTRLVIASTLALVAAPALAGCMGGDTVDSTFYVKDAPSDEFDEIWIEFSKVEVHHAGDDGDNETDGGDGSQGGQGDQGGQPTIASQHGSGGDGSWITTVDEARAVNLLAFNSSDAKAFLGEAGIPVGKYTQIRIHVDEAWGIDGSNNETITVSSGMAMVNRPWTVEDNGTTPQVTIDLNLDRSLTEQGDGSWRMTPVIGSVDVGFVGDDPREDQRGNAP